MPHGKEAASKTPMDAYVDGCRATWISTGYIRPGHPGDRPHDQPHPPQMPRVQDAIPPCLPSLERTSKSASLKLVALRSGIEDPADRVRAIRRPEPVREQHRLCQG